MSLIGLLVFVLICVVLFWLLGKAPIDPEPKKWITIILVVILVIWLLEAVGILGGLGLNSPVIRPR
jgi:predicted ferric reductase